MNIKHMICGAVATLVACILPSMPSATPQIDIIKHAVVGTAGIVSQAANPAATAIIVSQIVLAQWDSKSTNTGTTTSLALIAGGAIVMKTIKSVMDTQLSNRTAIKLIQEISINTFSMSLPLAFGALGASLIGWQNIAKVHNAIILPMVVPGITLLVGAKVLGSGKWKEGLLACGGGVLAIVASKYHPLGVGVVLGSIYGISKANSTPRTVEATTSSDVYTWHANTLEMVEVPQWIHTCIQLGSTLIGVPVSQLYSVMRHGYVDTMSDKTRTILEGVIGNVETMTSIMFYLLWGMAREGSFTDPMSKALQNTPIEWYIPSMGIVLVIGTVWYLLYYLDLSIPMYLNYKVEGVAATISSMGMLFLGAQLMVIPLWLPVIGLGLGFVSSKMQIDISLLGSVMPLIGIIGSSR